MSNMQAETLTKHDYIPANEILTLYAKGLGVVQIANILDRDPSTISQRLKRLLPDYSDKSLSKILPSLANGKAFEILSAIDTDKITKAGLGEMSNAAKRLIECNQVLTGKAAGHGLTVNINIGCGPYELQKPQDIEITATEIVDARDGIDK